MLEKILFWVRDWFDLTVNRRKVIRSKGRTILTKVWVKVSVVVSRRNSRLRVQSQRVLAEHLAQRIFWINFNTLRWPLEVLLVDLHSVLIVDWNFTTTENKKTILLCWWPWIVSLNFDWNETYLKSSPKLPKIPAAFRTLQVNTLQMETSDSNGSPFLVVG